MNNVRNVATVVALGCISQMAIAQGSASGQTATPSAPPQSPAQASKPAPESSQQTQSSQLEEIVVTAEKRTERALDVPTKLDVLSVDQLDNQGAVQLSDYMKQIPALNIVGASGPGQGQPVLRGISTGSDRASGVTIFLDEVPFTPSSPYFLTTGYSFDPDLANLERVEVLEGPQSTLYGASAMGGIIKYVTKAPSLDEYEGTARISGSYIDGHDSGFGIRGSINIPLVEDRLALTASAFYRQDPGFVSNLYHDQRDANEDDVVGGRLSLRFKLDDAFETTFMGMIQHIHSDEPSTVYLDPVTLKPLAGDLAYTSMLSQPTTLDYQAIANTSTYNTDFMTVTNILSYAVFKTEAVSDSSYLATELGFTPPAALAKSISSPNSGSFAEELRLTSAPGRLEWILGGFYTDQNGQQPYLIRGSDSSGNLLPPSNPFFNVYTYSSYPSYFERAIFGDITYHFTDQIQATVGSRYSAINQDVRTITSGLLGVNDLNNPSREKKITYLATVTYKPVQDLSIYARAGSAYRPGGANILNVVETAAGAASTYNADTLWNYEIGVKGTAWDQRLRYSADLFHMYWHDIQTSESIHGFSVITNAGGATSDGIEFALEALPIEGLTAEIKGAFMKTEYTTDVPCGKGCDPTPRGTPLPYSPHFTGTLNLDYDFEPYHEFTPTVGLTYSYHGSVFTPLSNFTSYAIPSYDTLDLRAGVTWAQYSIIGRINNIADTFGLTSAYAGAGTLENLAGGTVIQPRTFSLSFEAHF